MSRPFTPAIVSANDLFEGDVIYLDRDGGWTRRLRDAAVARTREAADALLASAGTGRAIGPYLVDVGLDRDDRPVPTHFREVFRERGPSTRPDLGRQADPAPRDGLQRSEGGQ